MKNNTYLKLFLAVALVAGTVAVGAHVAKGSLQLPDCSTVANPDPGINCTSTPSGGTGGGSGTGGTNNQEISSVKRLSPDDGSTANVYVDTEVLVSNCSTDPNVSIYLDGTLNGTLLQPWNYTSGCDGTFRTYVANGVSTDNGIHTITVSSPNFSSTSTNFTVSHHGAFAVNNPNNLAWYVQNAGDTPSFTCSSSPCAVSLIHSSGGVTLAVAGGYSSSVSYSSNILNRLMAKLFKTANASSSAQTVNAGQTTTATLTLDPCQLTVYVNGNANLGGTYSYNVTGATGASVGSNTYAISSPSTTSYSQTYTVGGNVVYTLTPSVSSPTAGGVTASMSYTNSAGASSQQITCPSGGSASLTMYAQSIAQIQVK